MKVLHILTGGDIGGIETLCKDYVIRSENENIVLFLNGGGILKEEIEKEGIRTIDLKAKTKDFLSIRHRIKQFCKDERVDSVVIHHSAPVSHLCALYLKKVIPRIRIVVYAHGCAEDMCRTKDRKGLVLRKRIIKKSFKKADRVIAISSVVKKSLVSYLGIENADISVLYNGVNLDKFYYAPKKINRNYFQLIYVGRLIPEKGVDKIIKTMSLLKDVDVKLNIVGDGSEYDNLKQLAIDHDVSERIDFLGKRRDIPELLNESDIFVHMPNWEEGFGITIIEAMACGLICVCGDRGAIPEIINDGIDGYVVNSESELKLSECIRSICSKEDHQSIENIKKRAIEKAKKFSIRLYVNKLDEIIIQNS